MCFSKKILLCLPFLFFVAATGARPLFGREVSSECEALHARARALFAYRHIPDSLRSRIAVARKARDCFGESEREKVMYLYLAEINALVALRQTETALRRFDAFFERFRAAPDSLWFRSMHHRRGYLYVSLQRYGPAIADYTEAVAYAATAPPVRRTHLTLELGILYTYVYDYEAARYYFRQADSLTQALSAAEDDREARLLKARLHVTRADLVLKQFAYGDSEVGPDELQRAVRQYEAAAEIYRREGPEERLARVYAQLAEAHGYLGDLDASRRLLARAARIAAALEDPALDVFIAHRRGLIHLIAGEPEPARRALERAVALADAKAITRYKNYSLNLLGLANEALGDLAAAERAYARAAAITEDQRASLGTTELSVTAFTAWQEPYRGLVRVRLARGRPEAAFLTLEQTRARHLLDLHQQTHRLSEAAPRLLARYDSLTTLLIDARDALRREALPLSERTALKSRETTLMRERDHLLGSVAAYETPSLDALRTRLAARSQVILSYFIDPGAPQLGRAPESAVFVITGDTLVALPLDVSGETLRTLMREVSPLLTGGPEAVSMNAVHFRNTALHELYERLVAPAAGFLTPGAPLLIIPDGLLFMLPFGILVEEPPQPFSYRETAYLFKKHPISVDIAATLRLRETPPADDATLDLLAYGKTSYNDRREISWLRAPPLRTGSLPNLPAVTEELKRIRRLFRYERTVLDDDATESSFFEETPSTKILHLAAHALVNPDAPLYNAIVLSPDPERPEYDGVVYLYELGRKRLTAQFVTLSGCSTARGRLRAGEGMAGLQYAFREMGVPSALSTLWLADDAVTALIMEGFYRNLQRGLPKDAALQQAQIRYLEEAPRGASSPFFWAAPVLYGSPDPISLTPRTVLSENLRWGLLVLSLAVLGLLTVFHLRRRARRAS
ncbi:CHAT domain-containing protein [Rhodocaloribacter sp.]